MPALSITTELTAAVVENLSRIPHNCTSDKNNAPSVMVNWIAALRVRPTKASTKTPINAPPKTISIGASNE